jgi:hypothetical protein
MRHTRSKWSSRRRSAEGGSLRTLQSIAASSLTSPANQPVAEAQLCPPHLNHVVAPPVCGVAPDAAARD